ncbi:PREDICTED: Krueppel-like factor 17 [Myotis brandtii]|uniref:Krueppel-like factor 17 n=1 Tax=Myotis brandtii TaxID=109478 RepID=UPI000703D643|nr:PREDICTED: Krueppel-like factor 17 [Myotis brandtii]
MDPTAEDPVQLSGNCQETHPLPQEIEEFVLEFSETHESRTPAAPEPQICMPLTARGEESQPESAQNQVMAPLTPTMTVSACSNIPGTVLDQNSITLPVNAFDKPPGELNETVSMDQKTHYGGQMTALKGDYPVTFIGNHSFTEGQVTTYSSDKTLYGGQMGTLKGDQMRAFTDDHTLGDQMRAFTDDHTLYGSHMMPCQSPSLPYLGSLYCSSSHLTQGQSLEEQKSKLKTQRRQFKKNLDILKPYTCTYQDCQKSYSKYSSLQFHYRKHTGERPYKCNVKGYTWEFARSDELKRHNKRHSGERPYLCTLCDRRFARSDHLQQHQKVHQ